MPLDSIRQKVWAGEVLTIDELAELRRAAQAEGGPTLRTMVAQALLNADADAEALPLLEALRREFPNHADVHFALGRALIGLERWNEAEAPLKRVLELNPGDPEALKALSVIALRRGEFGRARAWLEGVLQVDPFDGEAQQLLLTAERAEPGEVPAAPTLEDFIVALRTELEARSTPFLVQKDQLLLRQPKRGVVRLNLLELFGQYLLTKQPLAAAVPGIVAELTERSLGLPSKLVLLAKTLPLVRDAAFLERGVGAAHREGPAGLFVYYALLDPEVVRYVPEGVLEAYGVSLEQLDAAAWKNLEAHPGPVRPIDLADGQLVLTEAPTGLWSLATGDGHDAARLLTASHQARMEAAAGKGPWRVYLGLRELVLFCREADAAAVKKLDGLGAGRDGVAGAYRMEGGRLSGLPEWDVR